jgi:hypothetical protein
MKKISYSLFLLLLPFSLFCQAPKKTATVLYSTEQIRIDGVLDEQVWQEAPVATDFIQRKPYNGKPATMNTEVRFVYDNTGLYIAAMMYDPAPDSIPMQMGLRDAEGLNADYFMVMISPFNDGLNAFCFQVFVSDVQSDFKLPATGNSESDVAWDAVWQSKARKHERGWVVEMKIPYSAIRFPKTSVQEWGINCQRDIRRFRETDTWNFVDAKVQGYVNQGGLLTGINNIKPPLRLSMMPYVSGYVEKNPDDPEWQVSYNYGADLKYGINQSFTLDMTLIPDFGQVPSDDKIYNFSPFEIRYNEQRQFFTEGTELFNKGNVFYSRRVGSEPRGYNNAYSDLQNNEIVTENPMQTKLINASKVSGRTSKGLGIGVFNAISANTWATITDTLTGESRRVLTQGFTNYNMVVFDQNLKNNSYFDLLNTNYFMPTEGYTANVTGTEFKFANRKYTYALIGDGFVSQKYYSHDNPEFGYRYSLGFGKISGNFQFDFRQTLETDTYDPNDMGFNMINNRFNNAGSVEYNIYDPFWKLLNWYNYAQVSYNCLYDGFKFTSLEIYASSVTTTLKHLTLGMNTSFSPVEGHDYYEPRVNGWMYITPTYGNLSGWISSDYRKKFALDASLDGYLSPYDKSSGFEISLEPRFRASNRLMFIYSIEYSRIQNNVGYVMDSVAPDGATVILFGRRDQITWTNILEANFMISSTMSIDLRARHYWVTAPYYSFSELQENGRLDPVDYTGNQDVNFNLFNLDLTYIWNFAPGSQISLMWKNAITTFDRNIVDSFFDDFGQTLSSPASNSFSIRVLYYLDALYFKKKSPRN